MLTSKEFREKYKISPQTLNNWRKSGKVKYTVINRGNFLYEDIFTEETNLRMNVIYSRVSTTKQKDDLIRQEQVIREYMVSNGTKVDNVYTDIASGMNCNRNGLNKLLTDVFNKKIDTIYISYKDRLSRFGFEYFLNICDHFDTKIEILNSTTEEDYQNELSQDLISIIHHFSMKMYSKRRSELNKFKKQLEESK